MAFSENQPWRQEMKKRIIVQRHEAYTSGIPSGDPEKDKDLGHLTPAGTEGAVMKTRERLSTMGDISQTRFLIVYSPTYWFDDPRLGQRAKETADHVADTIRKNGGQIVAMQLDFRLGEALMFQTPFAKFLRRQCEGQGPKFWATFYGENYKDERMKYGAEGPRDIAGRMLLVINNAIEFLCSNEGPTVVWIITHGDCTVPLGMSYEIPIANIPEGYGEGFDIEVSKDGFAKIIMNE